MREHRWVWQQGHGPIPSGYIIHHRNEVRDDNRLENLKLMQKGQHTREHLTGRRHGENRNPYRDPETGRYASS